MLNTYNFEWKCPVCGETITAFGESSFVILKDLHAIQHKLADQRQRLPASAVLLLTEDDLKWLEEIKVKGD